MVRIYVKIWNKNKSKTADDKDAGITILNRTGREERVWKYMWEKKKRKGKTRKENEKYEIVERWKNKIHSLIKNLKSAGGKV